MRNPCSGKRQERHHEEMDEVDPYQSQGRWTHEPHKVMVVYPNDGDEQVTHPIADGRGPQRQKIRECRLIRCLKLQYHDCHDHREDSVRICCQPIRGYLFFTHSARLRVSKTSIDLNHIKADTRRRRERKTY
jgi:hypothetical protein